MKNLVERLDIMVGKDTIDDSDIPAPYNPIAAKGKKLFQEQLFLIEQLKDAKEAFEKLFIKKSFYRIKVISLRLLRHSGLNQVIYKKGSRVWMYKISCTGVGNLDHRFTAVDLGGFLS